jgi:alpha-L-fucosidase 2
MKHSRTLWYESEAGHNWNRALPVGNGRLGAMVFGNREQERLCLNEDSIWARSPEDRANRDAAKYLPRVRQLLLENKIADAQYLAETTLMGAPNRLQPYQPLGELEILLPGHSRAESYRRSLNLETATAQVSYALDGVNFSRQIFASAPDQVLVMRLECDRPGALSGAFKIWRKLDASSRFAAPNLLELSGQAGAHGTRFFACAQVLAPGAGASVEGMGQWLRVKNADSITLLLCAATDYYHEDYEEAARKYLRTAADFSFEELRARHREDHGKYFGRASFFLGGTGGQVLEMPTDKRLERVKSGEEDADLLALYWDFARYLSLGCAREGTLPANLQGIWNPHFLPPWDSDYHPNINLQMNYWACESQNLPECHRSLFPWMERAAQKGAHVAREHYGCGGWVMHHVSDAWGECTPFDSASCGLWPTGGAWLCDHLWEHWLFNRDREFLQRAYPILRGACEFFLDFCVEVEGQLLCGPSVSPENTFVLPDGQRGWLCLGPSMDSQILHELFSHTIEAARELNRDEEFAARVAQARAKLPEPSVGKHGQLMEWPQDWDEAEPGHRHISHAWALHPGTQISADQTPDLAQALRVTFERRLSHGGGHTGWSAAWLVNLWARLRESERAGEMLQVLLKRSTLPNLFDDHPPFQIDGNFGGAAGISEMLLQSHGGHIFVLPALPGAWSEGEFNGWKARGNVEVGAAWSGGVLQKISLRSDFDQQVLLRVPGGTQVLAGAQAAAQTEAASEHGIILHRVDLRGGATVEVRCGPAST